MTPIPLDIFIASYENPEKLDRTLTALREHTAGDFRCRVIDNHSTDRLVRAVVERHAAEDPRIHGVWLTRNGGYPHAVNEGMGDTRSEFVVYLDNDAYVQTPGWDQLMIATMHQHPNLGMLFAQGRNAGGSYLLPRTDHDEVLWGIGCFWMLRRTAMEHVGEFDEQLGHQEEVDYQIRLRMAGWRMGVSHHVQIIHDASASTNPEAAARINAGIIAWMNKWVGYFCGSHMDYFSNNVLRFEEWPPNALYLEEWALHHLGPINRNPEQVTAGGLTFDLIKHLKWAVDNGVSMYRERII